MRVEYDPEADAAYIYVSEQTVKTTKDLDDDFLLDLDENGQVVGLEILNAKKHLSADVLATTR